MAYTNAVCARLRAMERAGKDVIPAPELAAVAFSVIARGKSKATEVPEEIAA